jgi:hypothetical protein
MDPCNAIPTTTDAGVSVRQVMDAPARNRPARDVAGHLGNADVQE